MLKRALGGLLLAAVLGTGACGPQDFQPSAELEAAVLDVVVDSLPFLMRYTWGDGVEHPYTAVLSAEALALVADSAGGLGLGEEPGTADGGGHALDWLALQGEKPHVIGLCRTRDRPGPCRAGAATMVAFLSRPAFSDRSVARVHVRLLRQVGDLPTPWGAVGPFRAEIGLRMEARDGAAWRIQYVDLQEVGI